MLAITALLWIIEIILIGATGCYSFKIVTQKKNEGKFSKSLAIKTIIILISACLLISFHIRIVPYVVIEKAYCFDDEYIAEISSLPPKDNFGYDDLFVIRESIYKGTYTVLKKDDSKRWTFKKRDVEILPGCSHPCIMEEFHYKQILYKENEISLFGHPIRIKKHSRYLFEVPSNYIRHIDD